MNLVIAPAGLDEITDEHHCHRTRIYGEPGALFNTNSFIHKPGSRTFVKIEVAPSSFSKKPDKPGFYSVIRWHILRVLVPLYGKMTQQWNNKQLLDEVEQNIVICQWRADQLFADAEGRGK